MQRKTHWMFAAILGVAVIAAGASSLAEQISPEANGAVITDIAPAPVLYDQIIAPNGLPRDWRMQPPLVPHPIERYQIDLNNNQCLRCHDWNVSDRTGAPSPGLSHYKGRDGVDRDTISPARWFCTQCHVIQTDAPDLVENLFEPSR